MASPVQIVPATLDDLPDLVRLEEACFSAPWTRKMLSAELTGNQFARFLVARDTENGGAIAGYLCYWIVFEEVRLMNLAVVEHMRRGGIAASLVQEALGSGVAQAATRAVLEVRASNQAALALYRRFGFLDVSTRRNYYSNPNEDAVLMELEPIVVSAVSWRDRASVEGGIHSHSLTKSGGVAMQTEQVIAEQLRQSNYEFRTLEESHHELDGKLNDLQRRHVLTPQEELLKKQMQKEKLAMKDKMAELIRLYREGQQSAAH